MAPPPRRILTFGALVLVASAISLWAWRSRAAAPLPAAVVAAANVAAAPAPPPTTQEQTVIPRGSTFAAALAPFHLGAALISTWVRDARPVFNLGHIQAGKALVLVRAASGAPEALSYQIDDSHRLWLRAPASTSPAAAGAADWTAAIQTIPYQTRLVGVSGSVQSSLFEAVEDAGERDPLALALADI
ncbi:MAG TPA: hypothetical protein VNF74_05545, partial [Terriglobales bacterium]|nr:hypothetical protein [Terriglobales bacterium]